MFDLKRTLELVRGALFDPEPTWRSYLPDAGEWTRTALLLTGPLIVAASVIAYVVGLLGSDTSIFSWARPTLLSTLLQMITGAIVAGLVALIFSALSGAFGGKSSFALALAATTLAFVPAYAGQALSALPWIGGLLALVLFVWSLVLLWRIIPLYLGVPDDRRAGHYILSLLASIVAVVILSTLLGRVLYDDGSLDLTAGPGAGEVGDRRGGMYGVLARQAELMALAEEDEYTPPADGKLSERQVMAFIAVMDRAAELQAEKEERFREMAQRAEENEGLSISDFGEVMGRMSEIAGLPTSEIEIVKTGGGNWAEHQWVRESLRTAWVQRDINEAVEHNYRLYKEYEEELADYIAR